MRHLAAMLLFCLSNSANAQPVYRCGNEYSQTPCPQARASKPSSATTSRSASS